MLLEMEQYLLLLQITFQEMSLLHKKRNSHSIQYRFLKAKHFIALTKTILFKMQQYFLLFKITFQMESENHNQFNIDF